MCGLYRRVSGFMIKSKCILILKGITKAFPGTLVLSKANLNLHPGESHTLAGEDDTGKSTSIKIFI